MKRIETRIEAIKTPREYLRDNIEDIRELNRQDQEATLARVGRRFRELLTEFKAAYPGEVPPMLRVNPQLIFHPWTMEYLDGTTAGPIPATDEFWGNHGFELLQLLSLKEDRSRNGHAEI